MKKVFEPFTKSFNDVSQEVTKTMTETSLTKNKALGNLNNKLLEIMIDKGILASYFLSLLSKINIKPEHTSQFKPVKHPNSNSVIHPLINKAITVTLYENLLTFRDTDKTFKLNGELLRSKTFKKL